MTGLRLPVIAVAFVLTFLVLAGGYRLYQKYEIQLPVEKKVLATGLVTELVWAKPNQELEVSLNPVPDLREAYTKLTTAAGEEVKITLVDRPSPALKTLYQKIEPVVYEAAVLSNFSTMAQTVDSVAAAAGLDSWTVQLDERNIYLRLHQGKSYLYRVIPRRQEQGG